MISMVFVGVSPFPALGAPTITGVQPDCADRGEQATLTGEDLNININVTVANKKARVVGRTPTSVTFEVPTKAPLGATEVVAYIGGRGLGQEIGRLPFRVSDGCGGGGGVLLDGPPEGNAFEALFDVTPQAVPQEDIGKNGLILTQLEVALAKSATIGEFNSALQGIGALIVSMQAGQPFLTVSIPLEDDKAGVQAIADALFASPTVAHVGLARLKEPNVLPPGGEAVTDGSLLVERFPAAWNAHALGVDPNDIQACKSSRVPVVIADDFQTPLPDAYLPAFFDQVPTFQSFLSPSNDGLHGNDVTTTLAALFDGDTPTGTNPFSHCLDVIGVNTAPYNWQDSLTIATAAVPGNAHVVVNNSQGFSDECGNPCTPSSIDVEDPLDRVYRAVHLRSLLAARQDRVFVSTAAGNGADDPEGVAYPGAADARFDSPFNMVASFGPDLLANAADPDLWGETCNPMGCFPSLIPTGIGLDRAAQFISDYGFSSGPLPNIVIAGSGNLFGSAPSDFSEAPHDVMAIGEAIDTLGGITQGTSFAAPQVAGLATYLWMLSPELRERPVADTIRMIELNTFKDEVIPTDGVIDAYKAVLSLDKAAAVTPESAKVRFAILDQNNDGAFDVNDLLAFRNVYLDSDGVPNEPTTSNYSRWDLNGDGFTGGTSSAHKVPFDLDPSGSEQFGAPVFSQEIVQHIGMFRNKYNENEVTDADILCYYAFSELTTATEPVPAGQPDPRIVALEGLCKWEGAEYRGTITETHDFVNSGENPNSSHREVVAEITLTINPDHTFTPSGTVTFTDHGDPGGTGGLCTIDWVAEGQPTAYTGTFTTDPGLVHYHVIGTVTYSGDSSCARTDPFETDGGFPANDHIYLDGILTSIDFDNDVDLGSGYVDHYVWTGQLTLQPSD